EEIGIDSTEKTLNFLLYSNTGDLYFYQEIRELGQCLGDATIRKFHKRLTRNPADETIEFIRLWVDNERELDTEVEEEENSDSAGPSGTRE
ncbi:9958_t:CDS:2, partial [Ambispora gerdemannii]